VERSAVVGGVARGEAVLDELPVGRTAALLAVVVRAEAPRQYAEAAVQRIEARPERVGDAALEPADRTRARTAEHGTALPCVVQGDVDALTSLARIDTEPVSVSGLSETRTFETQLALPDGIEAVDDGPIQVTVSFRPVTESRSYTVGLELVGTAPGLAYAPSTPSVLLSVGGNPAALDAMASGTTLARLDVTGLEPGTYDVPVTAELPEGVTLVAASPATVSVTITAAPAASAAAP